VEPALDDAFKALADPTRRSLLDRLFRRPGLTLGALGEDVDMTRQALSQHLGVLEKANLVVVTWRGREKLHYLNPVPLHEIQQRWIHKFEESPLDTLAGVKRRAESRRVVPDQPDFIYVTYIEADPAAVWQALTDADLSVRYWGVRTVSTWLPGEPWEHRASDGTAKTTGTVVEAEPDRRLVLSWSYPGHPGPSSTVTFDLEPWGAGIVRLTVTHAGVVHAGERRGVATVWTGVLANLKTFLETGRPMPREPWLAPTP
jgi:uncharacterized protein YndB with AHSA1/START domain/DNA-binding transcriptional ArsR family regulator